MPSDDTRSRVASLDALRGVAILLVVLYHLPLHASGPLSRDLRLVAACGWAGVDLFFVLSGFLITGILYDSRGNSDYFRNFYMRRVLRIMPLYLVALVICFHILPLLHLITPELLPPAAAGSEWWFLAYLQNVRMALDIQSVPVYTQHFWSLAVEEQFYLIWPFVVLLCSRERLLRVTVAAMVGSVLLRLALVAARVDPLVLYLLTPTRLDGLAVGAIIALVARGPRLDALRWLRVAGSGAALLIAFFVWRDHRLNVRGSRTLAVVGYTAVALAAGALLDLTLRVRSGSLAGRIARNRVLGWIGRRSYAIYVIHFPAFLLLEAHGLSLADLDRRLGSWTEAAFGFLAIGGSVTLLLTVLSWRLLEAPALRLGRYFREPAAVRAPG
jgi:peptidoglycan/LPS O-acetylase OafA/YrhL